MAKLGDAKITVVQKRPFTCVVVRDGAAEFVGFSKVCWPDRWDARTGINIALGKAVAEMFGVQPPKDGERTAEFGKFTITIKADASGAEEAFAKAYIPPMSGTITVPAETIDIDLGLVEDPHLGGLWTDSAPDAPAGSEDTPTPG